MSISIGNPSDNIELISAAGVRNSSADIKPISTSTRSSWAQ